MPKTALIDMEMKISEVTRVNDPSPEFVKSLWQKIEQQKPLPTNPFQKRALYQRPGFIILIVALLLLGALFIGFGPQKVSAFIRNIFTMHDPGLQAVEEAGLVTDLDLVAEPALLPQEELSTESHPIYPVGVSETIGDSTLTLDWVHVDEGRLTIAYTTQNIQEGLEIGAPIITYNGFSPARQDGSIQSTDGTTDQTLYNSYQLIQADAVGETIGFSIDLPLLDSDNPSAEPAAQFHFELDRVPLYRGFTVFLQQTHQVTLNGISVQLESVQITSDYTAVTLCSDPENNGVLLEAIQDATFQFRDGPTVGLSSQALVSTDLGIPCSTVRFDISNPENAPSAKLTLNSMSASDSDDPITGAWPFYLDIPNEALFIPDEISKEATPIASQTQSDVTVTLDWVFVDALRVGLGYTITGLPDVPDASGLYGEAHLNDAEGNLIWGSGISSSEITRMEGQPGVLQGTWSVGFDGPLQESEIQLQWNITLDGSGMNSYIAGFPFDPEATPYPPGEFPPKLPDSNIGTYTFDFTAEVHPLSVVENLPVVTANGVQMSVPKALITPSMARVMVCYQKPTEKDWWIWNADVGNLKDQSMMVGGGVIYDADINLKPSSVPDGDLWAIPVEFQTVEHGRCLVLDFLQGQSNPTDPLIFTVDELQISPPEIYPDSELAAAREILLAQGIEFDYMTVQGQGGGGGGINFTVLPEGMTWEEAYKKFNEAMGYILPGPWVITLVN
ncbi:MAG: hypothetical protein H0S79_18645 [Anaerolineaceae bacterium]|nr:hypothetical protein [Anaerolineaceae bacterium]